MSDSPSSTSDAGVDRVDLADAFVDEDVGDESDPSSPVSRLREARKQIALAFDDLDVDGDSSIPLVDGDETFGSISLYANGDVVQAVQEQDGSVDRVEYRRSDALLFATCLRVLALDDSDGVGE